MKKTETIDTETGEILEAKGKLNELKFIETKRANGTIRRQLDYSDCPTLTEQHSAHLTDLNYLIEKYKPDELTAYLHARAMHRSEILGYDFTREPSLVDAKNEVLRLQKEFDKLPANVTREFSSLKQFLTFIDNPENAKRMLDLGLLTKKQIASASVTPPTVIPTPPVDPQTPNA